MHMHMHMHMHTWYLSTQPAVPTHAICFRTAPVQNTTNAAVELFGDGQLDWVYLDATHTYAEARNDLERWYPKVSQLSQAVVGGRRGTREWALLGGFPHRTPHDLAQGAEGRAHLGARLPVPVSGDGPARHVESAL